MVFSWERKSGGWTICVRANIRAVLRYHDLRQTEALCATDQERLLTVYAKLTDGTGNGAFAEAITRSGRAARISAACGSSQLGSSSKCPEAGPPSDTTFRSLHQNFRPPPWTLLASGCKIATVIRCSSDCGKSPFALLWPVVQRDRHHEG